MLSPWITRPLIAKTMVGRPPHRSSSLSSLAVWSSTCCRTVRPAHANGKPQHHLRRGAVVRRVVGVFGARRPRAFAERRLEARGWAGAPFSKQEQQDSHAGGYRLAGVTAVDGGLDWGHVLLRAGRLRASFGRLLVAWSLSISCCFIWASMRVRTWSEPPRLSDDVDTSCSPTARRKTPDL